MLFTVLLLIVVCGWGVGTLLLWYVPRCPGVQEDGSYLWDASLVVPARNEEGNMRRLLGSLAGQRVRFHEVIVVDDQSTDRTANVAREMGATVIRPSRRPQGWTGKTWACWSGAALAAGRTLVFMDADLRLEPGGVARLRRCASARPGLLTVQPYHRTERLYEGLSAIFNIVQVMGVGAFTAFGKRIRPAGGFGPCIVCDRGDYDAVGGHRAVREHVLEHFALARRFLESGRLVDCRGGRGTVSFRMYPRGPRELVEGWTKAFATGASLTPPAILGLTVAWLTGAVLVTIVLTVACIFTSSTWITLSGTAYAAYAGQIWWMLRRIGRFPSLAWVAYPAPVLFFLAVFALSYVNVIIRKRVTWKGRTIRTVHTDRRRRT
jgi:4,4'-diaponeurosporenoate glycosyltransferase